MKLLVDMLACQTYSRFRGIGRYTLSLVREMAKHHGGNDVVLLADHLYPDEFEDLRQQFASILPPGSFLPYHHNSLAGAPWLTENPFTRIAESLIEHAYQQIDPHVVLTPSLFEGWGGAAHGMVPLRREKHPGQWRVAILYDIIPYIFHEQYLDSDPRLREWYLSRLGSLHHYDLLLAISEASRRDAIEMLGLRADSVVNISGAASPSFRRANLSNEDKRQFLQQFGIQRPFVLYVGGNDFRKNMEGALRAYASLPASILRNHQLVLNDVGDEDMFRGKARKLGLEDADVVIFKQCPDEGLAKLYSTCELFIFPSLYEGFGLPVLEAMSCGAPVIASDTSSLPELVGRKDMLIEPADDEALRDKIVTVLEDEDLRRELSEYGVDRAKMFSWEQTAERAWDAIEALATSEQQGSRKVNVPSAPDHRPHIAYVSPLPPQKSGIADYSAAFLPYLAAYCDVDIFAQPGLPVSDPNLVNRFPVYSWDELVNLENEYDAVIYQMGNSELHIPMLELIRDIEGIVVSHDFFLGNLPFVREMKGSEEGVFLAEMDENHGLLGVVDCLRGGMDQARWRWPLNWKILASAATLIAHSTHQKELIDKFYSYGWKPDLAVIKQARENTRVIEAHEKELLRQALDLDPGEFLLCSFGFMAPTKLNNLVLRAFSKIQGEIGENSKLVFVGELEGGEYGRETIRIIHELGLEERVCVTGFVDKETYEKYLAVADAAIQLRVDSRGETSRALLDCFAFGIPAIVNAHGSLTDYSTDCVVRLPEQPGLDDLTQSMARLMRDDEYRLEKGQRSRNLIVAQHNPDDIAREVAHLVTRTAPINEATIFAPLVDALLELGSPEDLVRDLARCAAKNRSLRCQPRILIDVSAMSSHTVMLGETDAEFDLMRAILSTDDPSLHIELVHEDKGRWVRANHLVETLFDLPAMSLGSDRSIAIKPGDVLVILDNLLPVQIEQSGVLDNLRTQGGRIVSLIQSVSQDLMTSRVLESDIVLCDSRPTAENLQSFMISHKLEGMRRCDIFFPHLSVELKSIWVDSLSWIMGRPDDEGVFSNIREVNHLAELQVLGPGQYGDSRADLVGADVLRRGKRDERAGQADSGSYGNESHPAVNSPVKTQEGLRSTLLKSCMCTQGLLESSEFQAWVERIKGRKNWMHRKLWEWAFVSQALSERGMLEPGRRGLGFAVGEEPLPALFASLGCTVVATDLETRRADEAGWVRTKQHAEQLGDLNRAGICPERTFARNVTFRFVDMNHIDDDLKGFDFLWSSCSLEHLGSLHQGQQFIYESLRCLRPGGIAVHTTEYNISSNDDTLEYGPGVIYRRRDIEEMATNLRGEGHKIELDLTQGSGQLDLHVDTPPYKQDVHLRLEIEGYVSTSFGLIIQKGD